MQFARFDVRLRALAAIIGWALAGSSVLFARNALGCAPAPAAGEQVTTEREDALIVWNERDHREHFIRRAVFASSSKAFGFLVPTPTAPELSEVSERAFELLSELTAPPIVTRAKLVAQPLGCTALPFLTLRSKSSTPGPLLEAAAVTVLAQTRVAGLDATVLDATSPSALAEWLQARGFAFRDELKEWVRPYLDRHWKVTAFRFASDEATSAGKLASSALRMTFATEAPVYPYREPADQPSVPGRELRLFLIADGPQRPLLDEGPGSVWPAALPFSAPVTTSNALRDALPGVVLPNTLWLQDFRDPASRRPGADLVFRSTPERGEVHPPAVVVYREQGIPLPYELPFVVGAVVWWWRKRQRRAQIT
jgi:hypothetical protein